MWIGRHFSTNRKDMWLSSKVCKLLYVFLHVFRAEQTKEEDEDNRVTVTAENKMWDKGDS